MTHQDKVNEVHEVRAQVADLTDEALRSMLRHETMDFRWNAAADEINRRNTARRQARQARRQAPT